MDTAPFFVFNYMIGLFSTSQTLPEKEHSDGNTHQEDVIRHI